ncbi:MAG: hypothetical protein K1X55_13475 [Chitinophagales bacterium]|nr:hypothetical protein [Chitinophagales bacterium]
MSLQNIEQELADDYQKISAFSIDGEMDTLFSFNAQFNDKIFELLSENDSTLEYDFTSLKETGVYVCTSEDKKFRIYSWDTYTGGTMHFFNYIFQYSDGRAVYTLRPTIEEGHPARFYSKIYTFVNKGVTYYFGIGNAILSTSEVTQSIATFQIDGDELRDDVAIIKTDSGLKNGISVPFNFFSVVDRPERPVQLIKFDSKKNIIYIPLVQEDGTVTKKYIYYKFDGNYFLRSKTE